MRQKPLRLIVVEDHATTAEGLKKFLKAVGYQVFVATDMASALTLASSVQFDLLLPDWKTDRGGLRGVVPGF